MDIDVLTGWSREIQAPVDPEGSMRPTYRHADLLGLSGLAPLWMYVCVNNTGGKNEKCWRGLSCGFIRSVEAEVGDSARTRSDPYAVIVFAGRKRYAGYRQPFHSLKKNTTNRDQTVFCLCLATLCQITSF